MSETTKARLLERLSSLIPRATSRDDDPGLTRRLREALLDFGSETDDNTSAVERVTVGAFRKTTGQFGWGLRMATQIFALASVINSAGGLARFRNRSVLTIQT